MIDVRAGDETATTRCPVCGSEGAVEVHPAEVRSAADVAFTYTFRPEHTRTFRVVACGACTHRFCAPIPDDLAGHYVDVVDEEYLKHARSRVLAAEAALRVIARYQTSGALLDVGCATGDFLVAARDHGYRAEGVELSHWSARIARGRGFVVHGERLEALASHVSSRYDVITLWGVIEHFSGPATELAHVARLLRPGGIVVVWTGDVASLPSRLLGRKWWYWQGQHIQYFTRRSLRKLAEATGLRHVRTGRYRFALTWETLVNSLRRYRTHALLCALLRPFFVVKPVWHLALPGEMLFIARKPR